jgi:hypothetical protein
MDGSADRAITKSSSRRESMTSPPEDMTETPDRNLLLIMRLMVWAHRPHCTLQPRQS